MNTSWKYAPFGLLALFLCLNCGCGTVASLIVDNPEHFISTPVYGGVQFDVYAVKEEGGGNAVFGILDMPLSFALDTALLPLTLLAHFLTRDIYEKDPNEQFRRSTDPTADNDSP